MTKSKHGQRTRTSRTKRYPFVVAIFCAVHAVSAREILLQSDNAFVLRLWVCSNLSEIREEKITGPQIPWHLTIPIIHIVILCRYTCRRKI